MEKKQKIKKLFCIIFLNICIVSIFFKINNLIPDTTRLYSGHEFYRLQVDAFKNGQFNLPVSVSNIKNDSALFNGGVQQVWGLGIPILKTLFSVIFQPFPDRLFLFIIMVVTGVLCHIGTSHLVRNNRFSFVFGVLCSYLCIFFIPIFSLARRRFVVHEEAIFTSYFIVLAVFFIVLIAVFKQSKRLYLLGFILSGFLLWLRPTMVFYGLANCIILFLSTKNKNLLLKGSALFSVVVCLLLVTNHFRFGSFFEFGHTLNISNDAANNYQLKNDYLFKYTGALGAAKELSGALFLEPKKYYQSDAYNDIYLYGQSEIPRWRSFYSLGIFPYTIFIVIGVISFFLIRSRDHNKIIFISFLIPFSCLFLFYLKSPSISSRYINDFSPSVLILILFLLINILNSKLHKSIVVISVALVISHNLFFLQKEIESVKPGAHSLTYQDVLRGSKMLKQEGTFTFNRYAIKEENPKDFNINNGIGWDHMSGQASSSVQFFIPDVDELSLGYETSCAEFFKNNNISPVIVFLNNKIIPSSFRESIGSVYFDFYLPNRNRGSINSIHIIHAPIEYFNETIPCRLKSVDWTR